MFFKELKRGFSRGSFKIVIIIGIIASILSLRYAMAFGGSNQDLIKLYTKAYVMSPYDGFILFYLSPISNTLMLMLPILAAISYSDSYLEDVKSGYIKFICTRYKKQKYLISKYIANFVMGGVAFVLPLIFNIVMLLLSHPNVQTNAVLGMNTIPIGGLYPELFNEKPFEYLCIWLIIYFLYAGIFASIALSFSVFIRNKLLVLCTSFILCQVGCITLGFLSKQEYYPITFLFISASQHMDVIIGEFIGLLIVSFSLFYIGGKKHEIY